MKKKLLLLLILFILLGSLYISMPVELVDLVKIDNAKIFLYCKAFDGEAVRNGNGLIVETNLDSFQRVKSKARQIDGVSLAFQGELQDLERLSKELAVAVVFVEEIDTLTCVYGFSSKLSGGIVVNGQRINIQLVYNSGTVYVGSPLILGSY